MSKKPQKANYTNWNIGKYPYDHIPSCGLCITQHNNGLYQYRDCILNEHKQLVEEIRKKGLSSDSMGNILIGTPQAFVAIRRKFKSLWEKPKEQNEQKQDTLVT
jgi:hypothetical protein